MSRKLILTCLIALLSLSPLVSSAKWTCPSPSELDPNNPCECFNRNDMILVAFWVFCSGPQVTQQHIDEFMSLIRVHNDLLTVTPTPAFWLLRTNMTSLNISSLNNAIFTDFIVKENMQLQEITGIHPDLNLYFTNADLQNVPVTAVSSLMTVNKVSENLKTFYWRESKVGFSLDTPEFSYVMSRLGNITLLQLHYDNITSLTHPHFASLTNLNNLQLGYNAEFGDEVMTLGPDSLLLSQNGGGLAGRIQVNFYKNRLTNDNISPNSGLASLDGSTPVLLEFNFNEFEYISAENFEGFLNANPKNAMGFGSNPIVCDQRMKWLKDGRDQYESRVTGLYCTNDVGETIFTTDLV